MNNNLSKTSWPGWMPASLVSALGMLLCAAFVAECKAAPSADPSGGTNITWDCISSGAKETGIAFITFSSDFTFSGFEIVTAANRNADRTDIRRGGEGIGRDDGDSSSTNAPSGTNTILFGASPISGSWVTNGNGNILGSFERVFPDHTEGVSFVGKAVFGKKPRLTLSASTVQGHTSYHGVVAGSSSTPDISGQWFGQKTESKLTSLELFTLTASGQTGLYDLSGVGPNYSTMGVCIISSQGKIGFALIETPDASTDTFLRATIGGYKNTLQAVNAKTSGLIDTVGLGTTNVQFDATFIKP